MRKIILSCVACEFGNGTGHLHTGGAAADDDKGQKLGALGHILLAVGFGAFKRQQNGATHLDRVVNRFYAWCAIRPFGTEIAVRCARCQN